MEDKVIHSDELINKRIFIVRGIQVILDKDLAELYEVETGNLNKAMNRNIERFPEDFMFQLTNDEFKNLKFQFGISSWGGTRKPPYAFTEQKKGTHNIMTDTHEGAPTIKLNRLCRPGGEIKWDLKDLWLYETGLRQPNLL